MRDMCDLLGFLFLTQGRKPADVIPPASKALLHLEDLLLGRNSGESPATRRHFPADPSMPDIRNGAYSSDEFRMYSFKVRPCSRAYSHDWTECPFVHPGENARRRDPRKFHYSCVPCPEFRRGSASCRRGDMCEYAHGVFECWLHPAQYRTRLCKDGLGCTRQVCFFAHAQDELRLTIYASGGGVPSPRGGSGGGGFMDMASAMSVFPCSPPTSPSSSGWAHGNVPSALALPGNLQSSRLRSSFNARDIRTDDFDGLDEIFSASSPRFSEGGVFSPRSAAAARSSAFQQQQAVLSPINTGHSLLLSRMPSPGNLETVALPSPFASGAAHREKQHLQHMRSSGSSLKMSSRELGLFENDASSDWGSPTGKADWSIGGDDLSRLKTLSSPYGKKRPDLTCLVKEEESSEENSATATATVSTTSSSGNAEQQIDRNTVLGAWLEQVQQLDQLVV